MAAAPVPTPPPAPRAGVEVRLDGVRHRYADAYAVDDVSLRIGAGELVALLGPSGCGKSTLLRIVAGLLRQTEGTVRIGDDIVDALPPNERGAGIVFQSYALFPHMTVEANVAYGLRARGVPAAERTATDRTATFGCSRVGTVAAGGTCLMRADNCVLGAMCAPTSSDGVERCGEICDNTHPCSEGKTCEALRNLPADLVASGRGTCQPEGPSPF